MEKVPALRRGVAAFLASFLFVSQVVFANAAETNLWAERQRASRAGAKPTQLAYAGGFSAPLPALQAIRPTVARVSRIAPDLPPESVRLYQALSESFGSVRRLALPKGKSKGLIIHVEDVHLNPEAQQNIASVMSGLSDEGLGLVAVEGATTALPVEALRAFPEASVARDVIERRWKANLMPGPVYSALTTKSAVPLVGVDDAQAYRRNVQAYQEASSLQKSERAKIAAREAALEERKKKFDSTLRAFDRAVGEFRADRMPMADFAAALASRLDSPPAALSAFVTAVRLEKDLDFARASAERSTALASLASKLTAAATQDLLSHALAFRSGAIGNAEFYAYLQRLCSQNGIEIAKTPAFAAYLKYVVLAGSIDAESLFRDLRRSEEAVYASLAKTPEERSLIRGSRLLFLTGRLCDFALTPEEWEEYKALRAEFPSDPGLPPAFEAFYKEADIRDTRMASSLLLELEKREADSAALVAGGFHTAGLRRQLTEAGYTVATFTPKLTEVNLAEGSGYLGFFTRERTPIERIFQGRALFLAPPVLAPAETTAIASEMISGAVRRNSARPPLLAWFNGRLSKATGVVLEGIDQKGRDIQLAMRDLGSRALRRLNIGEPGPDGLQQISVEDAKGLGLVAAVMSGGFLLAMFDPTKFIPAAFAFIAGALFILGYRVQNGRWPWSGQTGGFKLAPAFAGLTAWMPGQEPLVAPVVMSVIGKAATGAGKKSADLDEDEIFGRTTASMSYLDELAADYGFMPADSPVVRFVSGRLDRLLAAVPPDARPRVRILARSGMGENAFVLPDGSIVISPEMVAFLDKIEELDALLLHEANHWLDDDFAASAEAYRSREVLRSIGLGRYHEYKADMRAFMQQSDPERDSSPMGMISLSEKFRTLSKATRRGVKIWDPEHGNWDDRILNMKTMLQFLDMFRLDAPMRPIPDGIRALATAVPVGKRIERTTERPPVENFDRWKKSFETLVAEADMPLLNRVLAAVGKRIQAVDVTARKRALYRTESELLDADRRGFAVAFEAWQREFDRRHPGLTPDQRSALSAIELETFAELPVISDPTNSIVSKTALKFAADDWNRRLRRPEFLAEVAAAFLRIDSPINRRLLFDTARRAVIAAVGPSAAFDRDRGGPDMAAMMDRAAEVFRAAGQVSTRLGYEVEAEPDLFQKELTKTAPTLTSAWTETVIEIIYQLMDSDQWKGRGKTFVAQVNRVSAGAPALTVSFTPDISGRVEDLTSAKAAPALRKFASTNWAPPEAQVADDARIGAIVSAMKKLPPGSLTLNDAQGGPLLRELLDQIRRLPVEFFSADFPKLTKLANIRPVLSTRSLAFTDLFTALTRSRKTKSPQEIIDLATILRLVVENRRRLIYIVKDSVLGEAVEAGSFTVAQLNDLANMMDDPGAVAARLGVAPAVPVSPSYIREDNNWQSAALRAINRELAAAGTNEEWFERLDRYVRSWPLAPSLNQSEVPPMKAAVLRQGMERLGIGKRPLADSDLRRALLLTFFTENPTVRLTVQGNILDRLIGTTDPVEMLDLVMKEYAAQGALGGLRILDAIEARIERVEDIRRFSDEGRRVLEGAGGSGLGKAVVAEGGLDYGTRRKSRLPLLMALLKSGNDDTELRSIIFEGWWDVFAGKSTSDYLIHSFSEQVDTKEKFERWEQEDVVLPADDRRKADSGSNQARKAREYPDGILRSVYNAGSEAMYVLLRKILVGENGVLFNAGPDLVKALSREFIDAAQDPGTAATIEKILGAVSETASSDELYLILYPLMISRIGNPPAEIKGWEGAVEKKARFISDSLGEDLRDELDLSGRAVMRRQHAAVVRKLSRLAEGDNEELVETREMDTALMSAATSAARSARPALSPVEFILESARQLGAPGVRFLQLLGQMVELPESFRVEFLSVYDDMRGQSKSSALETITREMPEYAKHIKRFVKRLGGGSLFTVFEVELDSGSDKEGPHEVVRVLNPNAMYHTEEALKIMEAAIEVLAEKDPAYAQARPLLRLLREWITAELKDSSFRADDVAFRSKWNGWRPAGYTSSIVVPESRWTYGGVDTESPLVRREELIGETDPSVPETAKNLTKLNEFDKPKQRELVSLAVKHYVNQLFSAFSGKGLVHSDVSPGNLRVTREGNLAILDRGMYLDIKPADAIFLGQLRGAGSVKEGVSIFVNQIAGLTENAAVAATLDKSALESAILTRLEAREADLEQAAIDMLIEVHRVGLTVPLKYTLLFKNFNALNRLVREAEPSWNLMDAFNYDPSKPFVPPEDRVHEPNTQLTLGETRDAAITYFSSLRPTSVLGSLYRLMPNTMIGWYAAAAEFSRTFRPIKFVRDHASTSRMEVLVRSAGVLFIFTAMIGGMLLSLSIGASFNAPTWLSVPAGFLLAGILNIVAHGSFNTISAASGLRQPLGNKEILDAKIAETIRGFESPNPEERNRAAVMLSSIVNYERPADSYAALMAVAGASSRFSPEARVALRDTWRPTWLNFFPGLTQFAEQSMSNWWAVDSARDAMADAFLFGGLRPADILFDYGQNEQRVIAALMTVYGTPGIPYQRLSSAVGFASDRGRDALLRVLLERIENQALGNPLEIPLGVLNRGEPIHYDAMFQIAINENRPRETRASALRIASGAPTVEREEYLATTLEATFDRIANLVDDEDPALLNELTLLRAYLDAGLLPNADIERLAGRLRAIRPQVVPEMSRVFDVLDFDSPLSEVSRAALPATFRNLLARAGALQYQPQAQLIGQAEEMVRTFKTGRSLSPADVRYLISSPAFAKGQADELVQSAVRDIVFNPPADWTGAEVLSVLETLTAAALSRASDAWRGRRAASLEPLIATISDLGGLFATPNRSLDESIAPWLAEYLTAVNALVLSGMRPDSADALGAAQRKRFQSLIDEIDIRIVYLGRRYPQIRTGTIARSSLDNLFGILRGGVVVPRTAPAADLAPIADEVAGQLVLRETRVAAAEFFNARGPVVQRLFRAMPNTLTAWYAAVVEFGRTFRPVRFIRDHVSSRSERLVRTAGVLTIYAAMVGALLFSLSMGASLDAPSWLSALAGIPFAALSNIVAHGVFNMVLAALGTQEKISPERAGEIAAAIRSRAASRADVLDAALPPVSDLLLRKTDHRGLLANLSRAELSVVREQLRAQGPVKGLGRTSAQSAVKEALVGGRAWQDIAEVAGKSVAITADESDVAQATLLADKLATKAKTLYLLVSRSNQSAFEALSRRPNVRILVADGALVRQDGSRTVHLSAVAAALSVLNDAVRTDLILAIRDADVIDNAGLNSAQERILAPVRIALLEALNALPITRIELDTIVDMAKVIAVQA